MAISLKNKNFAKSTLAEDLASDELVLDIAAGTGTLFPAAGYFRCVIWSASYGSPISDTNREFVTATLSGTDQLTLTRAQESTIARGWNNGDNIALVITAGKIDEIETEIGLKASKASNLSDLASVPTARSNIGLGSGDSPTFTGIILTDRIQAQPSHGSATFAMDVTDKTVMTIANDGLATPFSSANNFSGFLLITDQTNGDTAAFLIGGSTPIMVGTTIGSFTVTPDSANKNNLYVETGVVILQNKTGSQHTYYLMAFRTRTQL